jgi:hypothetical protein
MSARNAHAREEQLLDIYWNDIKNNRPLTHPLPAGLVPTPAGRG